MNHKSLKWIRILALALGLLLLVSLIYRLGWQAIVANLLQVGWGFLLVLAISGLAWLLQSLAWYQTFTELPKRPSLGKVMLGKIAGEAVNNITPTNFIGGDPYRVYFLRNDTNLGSVAASVVIDRTLQALVTVAMVILGLVAVLLIAPSVPSQIKYGLPVVVFFIAAFMTFVYFSQRRGVFSLILGLLQKLRLKKSFSDKTLDRFSRLDHRIIEFYGKNRRGFLIALVCHLGGKLAGVLEIYFIGNIITSDFSLLTSLVLAATTALINLMFSLIPGSIGVLEGAYGGVGYLMGLEPSVGVAIQLTRRIRSLVVTSFGFLVISLYEKKGLKIQGAEQIAEELSHG